MTVVTAQAAMHASTITVTATIAEIATHRSRRDALIAIGELPSLSISVAILTS
jgi:hypothetical protein